METSRSKFISESKRAQITYIILFTRCGASLEFTCHQISIIKLRRHVLLNLSSARSASPDSIQRRIGKMIRANGQIENFTSAPRRNRNCPWSASSIKLDFPETKRRREELRSLSVGMRFCSRRYEHLAIALPRQLATVNHSRYSSSG